MGCMEEHAHWKLFCNVYFSCGAAFKTLIYEKKKNWDKNVCVLRLFDTIVTHSSVVFKQWVCQLVNHQREIRHGSQLSSKTCVRDKSPLPKTCRCPVGNAIVSWPFLSFSNQRAIKRSKGAGRIVFIDVSIAGWAPGTDCSIFIFPCLDSVRLPNAAVDRACSRRVGKDLETFSP